MFQRVELKVKQKADGNMYISAKVLPYQNDYLTSM